MSTRALSLPLSLSLLLAIFAGSPRLQAQGIFPDKALEAAVRPYVFEKKYNDEPITEEDVKTISTIVSRGKEGKKIKSLAGLEKCRALALLHLENHEITDLAPLAGLRRLQSLNLAKNEITDITPLKDLKKLQYIQLEQNQVSDISPLAGLEAMNSLYLSGNRVKDLSAVKGLKKLWSLYLSGNGLEDIAPLKDLEGITNLDLRGNRLDSKDLESVAHMTELRFLLLDGNRIEDVGVLVTMAKKDAEKEKRFAPFWNVYLIDCPLGEAAKKQQVAELKKLGGRIFIEKKSKK